MLARPPGGGQHIAAEEAAVLVGGAQRGRLLSYPDVTHPAGSKIVSCMRDTITLAATSPVGSAEKTSVLPPKLNENK
ncbi:hypothetical protein E2C01_086687 [Portunus trituberculatus]|uniref:Uncharacterized protein n=1 Tax=Portunus trituberculatus TaxID=210409 RepID=A0A5B7JC47_PORTR|nr:hypothetical protein [Portunus trituberculatus]